MCPKTLIVYMRDVLSGAAIMMFINHINDKFQLIEAIIRKLWWYQGTSSVQQRCTLLDWCCICAFHPVWAACPSPGTQRRSTFPVMHKGCTNTVISELHRVMQMKTASSIIPICSLTELWSPISTAVKTNSLQESPEQLHPLPTALRLLNSTLPLIQGESLLWS